ncbi:unnamed protein product [Moneuplotes crassus]|uniref:Uncharacterized protein n=1 Tax=Euplotes crassus TaxID=5936 RepID=A0AAD2D3W6_EUPCR|nr:unnamed protein product [Moneuplotes crassus]
MEKSVREENYLLEKLHCDLINNYFWFEKLSAEKMTIGITKEMKSNKGVLMKTRHPIGFVRLFGVFIEQEEVKNEAKMALTLEGVREVEKFRFKLDIRKPIKYERYLLKGLYKVQNCLHLQDCHLTKNQFRKLIQTGRHIPHFKFQNCTLDLTNLTFTPTLTFSIKFLEFERPSSTYPSSGSSPALYLQKDCVYSLMKSIAESNLQRSLQKLAVDIELLKPDMLQWKRDFGLKLLRII